MLEYLKNEAGRAFTENGAVTERSSGSACLDLFATIGALRREHDREIAGRFLCAYAEDPDLAMKILFFARDVRGGLGERRVFRTVLRWLAQNERKSLLRNLRYVAEYGRWDDLLVLLDTPCRAEAAALLKKQFRSDLTALDTGGEVSLLGKWLPSVNASNMDAVRLARSLARAFGMTERGYRKALVRLRAHIRILENSLRERDYSFDYARQPSKALLKYRRAFLRNDGKRYAAFLEKVNRGEAVMHTGALLPYEIVAPFLRRNASEDERAALDTTWRAQEDFTGGENALVVIDGSGSMYGGAEPLPAAVALSLGIYTRERKCLPSANIFVSEYNSHISRLPRKGRAKWRII